MTTELRRRSPAGAVLTVIAGASLLIVLSTAIVTIALPSMAIYFHRSQSDMTWAVNSYTLAFGGLLLLGGRAADVFGRRRTLIVGLAIFSLGSLAAGLATSFDFLLAGRSVEGVGAAIASPTALSLITTDYDEGPTRNRAIAIYAAVSGAGAAIGLLLGGVFTEYASWRWVFFINVPIGALLILATFYAIGESERRPARLDVIGSLLSAAGLAGVVYGLVHASDHGWHGAQTVVVLAASVLLLVAFVVYEGRVAREPILALRLFADRNRAVAYFVILAVSAAVFGLFYFITFFVQGALGYSALQAGFAFLPAAVAIAVSCQASSQLMHRVGPRPLLVAGTVLLTGALLWLSQVGPATGYPAFLLPATIVVGIGLGATLVPLTTVITSRLVVTEAGLGSAVLNVGQQVGATIGLAVLANVASNTTTDSGTHQATKLIGRYGVTSNHFQNFVHLGQALLDGATPPRAAALDPVALGAVHTVQAQVAGHGFLTATIFATVAIVAGLGITTKASDLTLDDVHREPAP